MNMTLAKIKVGGPKPKTKFYCSSILTKPFIYSVSTSNPSGEIKTNSRQEYPWYLNQLKLHKLI